MAFVVAQVCHERNIHGRSLEEVRSAALAMESIPSLYPQLDASGLLQDIQPKRKQVKPLGSGAMQLWVPSKCEK